MKWKKIKFATVIAVLLAMVAATACTNGGNEAASSSPGSSQDTASPSASKAPAMAEGPYGKYDPPITLTTVKGDTPGVERLPDQTLEDNVWTREYLSELGISLKYNWIVNTAQYPNKVMVTIVSGDLPDFFEVNAQQFQTLAQAGQLADLSDVLDKYGTDLVKTNFDEAMRRNGTVEGKLLGFPRDGQSRDDANMLYIRKDWLDKLGLQPPKTMDELMNVAIAFATKDPDGNNKQDTYGLALSKDLFDGFATIAGFLNGYGAYAYNPANGSGTNLMFQKDASGKLVYGDIQPEVKTALGKLQELFVAGAIHPEFSVQDGGKVGELMTSGKVGMLYGAFWVPTWPIQNMKQTDPTVDWRVYEAPAADGSPSVVQSTSTPTRYLVVSKNAKHPEALIKIINYTTEKLAGTEKNVEKYHTVVKGDKNYSLHTLAPAYFGTADTNQNYFYQVEDALKKNDPSAMDDEAKMYYEQVKKFEGGDYSQFSGYALWGPGGVFDTLGKYKKNDRIKTSVYTGAPTPTMLSRGPSLRDLEVKTFIEIIMGAKPLDAFDEFADQWLKQGGQDILDEVNASGQVQ